MSASRERSSPAGGLLASIKSNPYPLLLAVVVLAAALLRLYGLDWDRGFSWSPHPDERAIIMKLQNGVNWPQSWSQFLSKDSALNPLWFAYGSLPFYLLKSVTAAVGLFDHNVWAQHIYIVGRALSALFDVGTVLLVYFIGKRLYSRKVGLLGSALVAFAVLHIQLSHFFTVDSLLAFFVTLTLFFCAGIMKKGDTRNLLLAGVSLGLAVATKISAAPLALAIVTAFAIYLARSKPDTDTLLKQIVTGLPVAAFAAVIAFVITEPYAILDWATFMKDTIEQSGMARGTADWPFTRQYINTTAYLYDVQQSTVWGLGLLLGVASWGGLVYSAARAFFSRRASDLLLLSWVIPYFLIIGSFRVKYLRYLLPMTPVLCLMGSALLFDLRDRLKGKWKLVGSSAIVLVVVTSLFYAIAYDRIYSQPHTAVSAAEWVNQNVPAGSKLLKEHWEEGLPDLGKYPAQQELPIYDDDSASKMADMAKKLNSADYLVEFSNRLYGTIPRLPERYPMTSRYYELLFSGQLGFELVDASVSYPNLLGVTLVDDTFARPGLPEPDGIDKFMPGSLISLNLGYADESFTVYDHPKVLIFKNVGRLSAAQIQQMLVVPVPAPAPQSQLLMQPSEAEDQQSGGTWSDLFSPDSLPNRMPVLFWLLAVELFSLAALPLTMVLFRSFADRGYLLAKTFGILAIAYFAWLAASTHAVAFSQASIFLGFVALAAVSALILIWRWSDISGFFRTNWKLVLIGETLFLVAFLAFYGVRLWNPDMWHPYRGGEKPMDFAFLNAVIKSSYMPPYDPWFSGGFMNYYYFGQFIVATLIKVTGIVPSVAYNLAVPLLFALTLSNAFCLVFNLVQKKSGKAGWMRSAIIAGLVGAAFVTVAGNLDGMAQLIGGAWQALVRHQPFPAFDFWRSTRVSAPSIAITEFPFFTFLFADLHAHLIALPFTIAAIALAFSFILDNREGVSRLGGLLNPRTWLWLLGISLVLGALRVINSWDYPTYMLLAAAAVLIAEYASRKQISRWMLLWAGVKIAIVIALSYKILFLPFDKSYQLFYSGIDPSPEKTYLYVYLLIHGLFLFLIATWLRRELDERWKQLSFNWKRSLLFYSSAVLLVFAALIWKEYFAVALMAVLAAMALALVVVEMVRRGKEMPVNLFVLCLIGLALAVGIGVDFITLKGDIVRMNTVFKFYLQVWVLFGLASGYLFWLLVIRDGWWRKSIGGKVWIGFLVFFIVSAAIYPVAGARARANDRFNPLPPAGDSMEFMKTAVYHDEKGDIQLVWDYEALRWMQMNIQGSPVIIEGLTPFYRWGGRVSVYTGLPAVFGWDWHERQQRWDYQYMIDERIRDVNEFYTTTDPARATALLKKYGVRYVYVGRVEQLYYPPTGLAKFDNMAGQQLDLVYQNQQVKVYGVRQ